MYNVCMYIYKKKKMSQVAYKFQDSFPNLKSIRILPHAVCVCLQKFNLNCIGLLVY